MKTLKERLTKLHSHGNQPVAPNPSVEVLHRTNSTRVRRFDEGQAGEAIAGEKAIPRIVDPRFSV